MTKARNHALSASGRPYRPFSSLGYFRRSCESTWRTCINLYCVTLTYVRLRSGHMTQEKGLLIILRGACFSFNGNGNSIYP